MKRLPDFYYTLPDSQLLALFRAGDTDAAVALVDRHDGNPPVEEIFAHLPTAVAWVELLAGRISLHPHPVGGEVPT